MSVATTPGDRKPDDAGNSQRRTGFWSQAAFYLLGGGLSTVAQSGIFLALREVVDSTVANLCAVAITTIASTAFHRRVTFAGSSSSNARRWTQSLLTFAFYASYNTVVLLLLNSIVDNPSPLLESAALIAFAIFGGTARFLLLRWWVFHFGHRHKS